MKVRRKINNVNGSNSADRKSRVPNKIPDISFLSESETNRDEVIDSREEI